MNWDHWLFAIFLPSAIGVLVVLAILIAVGVLIDIIDTLRHR